MSQIIQIQCNLCGGQLTEFELVRSKGLLGMGADKPTSNNNIIFVYNKQNKKGDLCSSCAKKISDYMDTLKKK